MIEHDDPAFTLWLSTSGAWTLFLNPLFDTTQLRCLLYSAFLAGRMDGMETGMDWLAEQRRELIGRN